MTECKGLEQFLRPRCQTIFLIVIFSVQGTNGFVLIFILHWSSLLLLLRTIKYLSMREKIVFIFIYIIKKI